MPGRGRQGGLARDICSVHAMLRLPALPTLGMRQKTVPSHENSKEKAFSLDVFAFLFQKTFCFAGF